MSWDSEGVLAGRYRRLGRIGQGGMGAVWRAHDTDLDREVAIKELRVPEQVTEQERRVWYARMEREARAAARLRHPGIVTVYDRVMGEDGRPWIVMELIHGPSLAQVLTEQEALPEQRVAAIGLAMLAALSAAHADRIVHRDVKPANVLLEGDRIVLTDFGIAAVEGDATLTRPGTVLGTPAYMSPEQVAGRAVTPASDLWSLGATLYAAVEGRPPFTARTHGALFISIATQDPAPPECGEPLAHVLNGLLRKDPADRLSVAQIRALLTTVTGSGGRPGPQARQPATRADTLRYTRDLRVAPFPDDKGPSQPGRASGGLPEQEAVAKYRQLAEADPDRYRADLALSLRTLGLALWKLNRFAEAASAEQEAVAKYRQLAEADPDRYRPDLALSLSNLGRTLKDMDRHAEAAPVRQEAVAKYRQLAEADPDRYRADLASSLYNLGGTLWKLDRFAEAAPMEQEAAAIRRRLAEADPDRYRPAFAAALSSLGVTLWKLDRFAEAAPVEQEAVAIRRQLAEADPDRYRPALASSLSNLGSTLKDLDRHAEAAAVRQEAVAKYRHLAEADPGRYRADLALSLHNLGSTLWNLNRFAEAVPAEQEAVSIRRQLAEADPGRYRSALASSLHNLSLTLKKLDRHAEAARLKKEADAIRKELGRS
ncbi:protein kinase domain-containing protein [Actinomadura violacea]|uniref:non-specific serine/threonine protein kinase n=1 Tax=Actinomadura violacea TaxID=2819934 RepID=A0ABS3S2P2_9ACTN|nr:serine/threonine-protein kinase [Actinomadura violacea]MBO2463252.1 serine/threonine protein kinase [Actinomadura violacea]